MNFLRKLLGGGANAGDKDGVYFYVRAKRTGEVIQIRLHRFNDLSASDDSTSFYTRKVVVGQRSFDRIEIEFYFDKNRNFVSADVSGGTLVERADFEAFQAEQAAASGGQNSH
jgi:hypothetical protein